MNQDINTKVGKRGSIVIPVVTLPVEIYTKEQKAEFLLNNTVTVLEYDEAAKEVRAMGLDPEAISHKKPDEA